MLPRVTMSSDGPGPARVTWNLRQPRRNPEAALMMALSWSRLLVPTHVMRPSGSGTRTDSPVVRHTSDRGSKRCMSKSHGPRLKTSS
jgi:hypothetical protein